MNPFPSFIIGTMRWGQWGSQHNAEMYERLIDQAIDMGIHFFDHADIYGSYTTEAAFGTVLKQRKDLASKVQIVSKFGIRAISEHRPNHQVKTYDSSASHLVASVEQSLTNLGVDSIHTYLLHRPDYLLHPEELAKSIDTLKRSGKIQHFGVSNFTSSQFELLYAFTPLITNQIEFSIDHLQPLDDGTLDQSLRHGLPPMIWSPLGNYFTTPRKHLQEAVKELCVTYACEEDQLLLAWARRHPSQPIPVLGTTQARRIQSAIESRSINLSTTDWYRLLEVIRGHPVA